MRQENLSQKIRLQWRKRIHKRVSRTPGCRLSRDHADDLRVAGHGPGGQPVLAGGGPGIPRHPGWVEQIPGGIRAPVSPGVLACTKLSRKPPILPADSRLAETEVIQ